MELAYISVWAVMNSPLISHFIGILRICVVEASNEIFDERHNNLKKKRLLVEEKWTHIYFGKCTHIYLIIGKWIIHNQLHGFDLYMTLNHCYNEVSDRFLYHDDDPHCLSNVNNSIELSYSIVSIQSQVGWQAVYLFNLPSWF